MKECVAPVSRRQRVRTLFTGTVMNVREDGFAMDTEVSPSDTSAIGFFDDRIVVELQSTDNDHSGIDERCVPSDHSCSIELETGESTLLADSCSNMGSGHC
jgi:hypothetical protein